MKKKREKAEYKGRKENRREEGSRKARREKREGRREQHESHTTWRLIKMYYLTKDFQSAGVKKRKRYTLTGTKEEKQETVKKEAKEAKNK